MLGVRVNTARLVIDRAHGLPMGRGVGEAAGAHFSRQDVQMRAHGKVTVHALTNSDFSVAGFCNHRMPPHGNDAPRAFSRKEVPVSEHIANDGISDVVCGYREAFDFQPECAIPQYGQVGIMDHIFRKLRFVYPYCLRHYRPSNTSM